MQFLKIITFVKLSRTNIRVYGWAPMHEMRVAQKNF